MGRLIDRSRIISVCAARPTLWYTPAQWVIGYEDQLHAQSRLTA